MSGERDFRCNVDTMVYVIACLMVQSSVTRCCPSAIGGLRTLWEKEGTRKVDEEGRMREVWQRLDKLFLLSVCLCGTRGLESQSFNLCERLVEVSGWWASRLAHFVWGNPTFFPVGSRVLHGRDLVSVCHEGLTSFETREHTRISFATTRFRYRVTAVACDQVELRKCEFLNPISGPRFVETLVRPAGGVGAGGLLGAAREVGSRLWRTTH